MAFRVSFLCHCCVMQYICMDYVENQKYSFFFEESFVSCPVFGCKNVKV